MTTPATVCCKVLLALVSLGAVSVVVAGCGGEDAATPTEVVLVTHDSFAISKDVKAAFEAESGLRLRILQAGDANETLNRALLTAGDPQGDVIFGIDDSVLSRALEGDLLAEYRPDALASVVGTYVVPYDQVTPIDHGEVCLNVDRAWFAERRLAAAAAARGLHRAPLSQPARRREPRDLLAGARVPARDRRALRRGRLAVVLARAPRERGARGRRLGGGVHAAVLRGVGQPRQASDRRLVRDEPGRGGHLRREAARGRTDRRRSRTAATGRSSTPGSCEAPETKRAPVR